MELIKEQTRHAVHHQKTFSSFPLAFTWMVAQKANVRSLKAARKLIKNNRKSVIVML